MMSVHAECPACGEKFRRPNGLAGRLEKCPACRHVFRLPTAAAKPTGIQPKSPPSKAPVAAKPPGPLAIAKTAPPVRSQPLEQTPPPRESRPKKPVREESPPEKTPMVAAPPSAAEEDAGRVQWPKPSPAWQPEEGRRHQEPSAPAPRSKAPPEPATYVPANETPADETPAGTALVVHDEAASLPATGEPRPTELAGVWEIFPLDTSFPSPPPAEDLAPPPAEAQAIR